MRWTLLTMWAGGIGLASLLVARDPPAGHSSVLQREVEIVVLITIFALLFGTFMRWTIGPGTFKKPRHWV